MYDDILVPTDGSEGVQPAIDHAIELASRFGATIHALFVVEAADTATVPEAQWVTIEGTLEDVGEDAVADIESRARQRNIEAVTTVTRGTPHEEIVAYSDQRGIDLVVMGTHGRSGLDRVLLGSVTENVIRQSDVPVLVRRIENAD